MGSKISMTGLTKAINSFEKFKSELADGADDGAREHIDKVFDETQRVVPKETIRTPGTALKDSGKVLRKNKGKYKRSWSIWYGEPGEGPGIIDYAAAVHEILDAEHKAPTRAKFVEVPLLESIPRASRYYRSACRLAVKKAFR
jgi:hypothetical protein